jgi:hypothetical protein
MDGRLLMRRLQSPQARFDLDRHELAAAGEPEMMGE